MQQVRYAGFVGVDGFHLLFLSLLIALFVIDLVHAKAPEVVALTANDRVACRTSVSGEGSRRAPVFGDAARAR